MQTFESLIFFSGWDREFRNLQILKIINIDTNRIFPIPYNVIYISLRYT